jgi:glycosyltransferase involved in cell wall biosynthesis
MGLRKKIYFSRCDVFVLPSYAEGLPNVLVEAMMCKCSPVSTDCPTGPREVLQDGKYGKLVPVKDPLSMASAIIQSIDNPVTPENLKKAIEPFKENAVIKRHFDLLEIKEKF